jgi:hypothetical protein
MKNIRKPERQKPLVRLWYVREHTRIIKIDKGTEYEGVSGN